MSDERNATMVSLYRSGQTLQQIGDAYGMTRERVRQILKAAGVSKRDGGAAVRFEREVSDRRSRAEAESIQKTGMPCAMVHALRALGSSMRDAGSSYSQTPIGAFRVQRNNALRRGIEWRLSLAEWWAIWEASGRWESRGTGQGYVMCREGDKGPYAVGNVYIATARENTHAAKHKKSALPMGVSLRVRNSRRYYVAQRKISGRALYLGVFETPEQAHAAYLRAGEDFTAQAAE